MFFIFLIPYKSGAGGAGGAGKDAKKAYRIRLMATRTSLGSGAGVVRVNLPSPAVKPQNWYK